MQEEAIQPRNPGLHLHHINSNRLSTQIYWVGEGEGWGGGVGMRTVGQARLNVLKLSNQSVLGLMSYKV